MFANDVNVDDQSSTKTGQVNEGEPFGDERIAVDEIAVGESAQGGTVTDAFVAEVNNTITKHASNVDKAHETYKMVDNDNVSVVAEVNVSAINSASAVDKISEVCCDNVAETTSMSAHVSANNTVSVDKNTVAVGKEFSKNAESVQTVNNTPMHMVNVETTHMIGFNATTAKTVTSEKGTEFTCDSTYGKTGADGAKKLMNKIDSAKIIWIQQFE